ncbi:MAG: hypothetical protein AABX68_01830 [Nanoarchaeota archaeon]
MARNLPKVKFYSAPLKHFIKSLNHFLNPKKEEWDWSRGILRSYLELEMRLKGVTEIEKRKNISSLFFQELVKSQEYKKEIKEKVTLFQKEWDKINDYYMLALSKTLEIDWPKKDKVFKVFVSPNPICPRFIKERVFDAYYRDPLERMIAISIHEILHFLWFEKWKEVFPKTPKYHFDEPYLEWKISEMVPRTILSDKSIQNIFNHKPLIYDEYAYLNIKGRLLPKHLGEFYYKRKDIEDFIKKSWEFVKKHEKEINKA